MRDGPVAHPLAFQQLDAAQTLPGDPSPTATPAFLATERRHPTLHIARLVAPHGAHRSAKRPRHIH
ncbi:MAG TPA: hypothetical protein VML56_06460, partial [Burkholderiales bacterium]|nr:hypothetical protein [Burkholderiales bacterium]